MYIYVSECVDTVNAYTLYLCVYTYNGFIYSIFMRYVRIYVCVCVRAYVCVCVCDKHMYNMFMCMHVYVYICVCVINVYTVCVCMRMYGTSVCNMFTCVNVRV